MAQTDSMDYLIRPVNKDVVANGEAQKLVYFDADNRVVLERRPIFAFFDLRCYLVFNTHDPRNRAEGTIAGYNLHHFDETLPVSVSYAATCRPGHEGRVTKSLFDLSLSLREVLENHLKRWLVEIGERDIPAFVATCLDEHDRAAIEAKIAEKAFAETGIDLAVRLSLDWEKLLAPLPITREHLSVIVSDFQDEEQDLGVKLTLELDEERKRDAILKFRAQQRLPELMLRELVRYVRQQVSLPTFMTLHSTTARQHVAEYLNGVLAPYGRKVGLIRLEPNSRGPETFFQGQRGVEVELHEYPQKVVISNKVQMIMKDVVRYRAAKSPDLKTWLAQNLDRYVPQILFGASYLDVLIGFDEYKAKIKDVLTGEAEAIGYSIQQLITTPELEPITWMKPFPLEVGSTRFETRLAQFYVTLQFNARVRIPNLETVKQYLNRDKKVPELMTETIVAVARELLHSVQPQRFYMRFSYTPDRNEKTVEQELVAAIKKRLRVEFGAEVYEVVVKVSDTDPIVARIRKLRETICPFAVALKWFQFGEMTTFHGNFQVDTVDAEGWERFQRNIELDQMRTQLEQHLEAKLNAVRPQDMQYHSPLHHKQLEDVMVGLAQVFMREQFGVIVRVTNIRRDATPNELLMNKKLIEDQATAIRVEEAKRDDRAADEISASHNTRLRIEDLYEQLRLLAGQPGTEDEMKEIEKRIEHEREAIAAKELLLLSDVQKYLLPSPPEEGSTLRDVAKLAGLPDPIDATHLLPPDTKPLLQGDAE
jgi:hypothetical protein